VERGDGRGCPPRAAWPRSWCCGIYVHRARLVPARPAIVPHWAIVPYGTSRNVLRA
jgi:hypothetical protein